MLPARLLTVMTPSATVQPAAVLSRWFTHASRFLPSKSTIASDGGATLAIGPGVTIAGTGSQTSVSSGRGPVPLPRPPGCCCAAETTLTTPRRATNESSPRVRDIQDLRDEPHCPARVDRCQLID